VAKGLKRTGGNATGLLNSYCEYEVTRLGLRWFMFLFLIMYSTILYSSIGGKGHNNNQHQPEVGLPHFGWLGWKPRSYLQCSQRARPMVGRIRSAYEAYQA